jgi:hypothetical protein
MSNSGLSYYFDHAGDFMLFNNAVMNRVAGTAGMAIKAGSSAVAKFANTVNFLINGKFYAKTTADVALPTTYVNAAGVSVAAVIPDGYKAFVAAFLDADGTVSSAMTIPVLSESTEPVLLPSFADTLCCIGGVLIDNASSADFTNATTALDKTGVTTTYVNLGVAFPNMQVA